MVEKKAVIRRCQAASEGVRRALAAKVSRRTALRGMDIDFGLLADCSDDGDGDALTAGTCGGATDSNAGDTSRNAGTRGTGSATAWATGGTAAMLAAASCPDPFETAESGCALTSILTQGPCWAPTAAVRQDIDGCFPGWYRGRSIHLHVLVRAAANAGESTTTNHGQPDTGFDSDNVLTTVDDITPYIVDYERMSDGAMLAWKNIVISSSDSCSSSGAAPGGGGPGGALPGAPAQKVRTSAARSADIASADNSLIRACRPPPIARSGRSLPR